MGGSAYGVPRPARQAGWLVAALAITVALAIGDAVAGGSAIVSGLFIVGPLLAAARTGPRDTAIVAATGIVLAIAVGAVVGTLGEADHWLRVAVVAAGGALAIWIASLRAGTEAAEAALRSSRDQLSLILGAVADGITVQGPDGGLIYANEAAVRSIGFDTAEELLRAPIAEVLARFELFDEDGQPFPLDRLPGRLALGGEPAKATVRSRDRATGEETWSVIKAQPVIDDRGKTSLVINVMEDLTERKAGEQAQRFLADVATALAASLDYETTLRTVAQLAVPAVADHAAVDIDVPDDPARAEAVRAVLDTGAPKLSAGLIIAPLIARGRPIAALSLMRNDPARAYDAGDLAVAVEVGRRAGLALDNARLFTERAYIARALQESLLPPVLPAIPGLEVASRFRAAGEGVEVGGDFYDLFEVGDGGWALVVGDVCGKGPDAAAVTALARYTIRAGAMQRTYPSHILTLLNDALLRQRGGVDFCTVALGRFDVREDGAILVLASGGHPLPLLLTAEGDVRSVGEPGSLLGVLEDPELRDVTIELASGDTIVFYTDGVTEAGAPRSILGPAELDALVASCAGLEPSALAERIEQAAVGATVGEPRDDLAILVARVRPPDGGRRTAIESAEIGAAEAGLP